MTRLKRLFDCGTTASTRSPVPRATDEVSAAVAVKVRKLGIEYPVLIDCDFRYWRALEDWFWPAYFLIDPQRYIVATRIGELLADQSSADPFERQVAALAAAH